MWHLSTSGKEEEPLESCFDRCETKSHKVANIWLTSKMAISWSFKPALIANTYQALGFYTYSIAMRCGGHYSNHHFMDDKK